MSDTSQAPTISKKQILGIVGPILASAAMAELVGFALSKIKMLTATNSNRSDVTGDHDAHPTNQETNLSKSQANGAATKSSLANDDVKLQEGQMNATSTEAQASNVTASASDAGAVAARTKAGASDIEAKGLKMM